MKKINIAILAALLLTAGCTFPWTKDKIAAWDECTKASCWNGSNAQQRMMNMLSPGMSDEKFQRYADWMKGRGCNTAHLILANRADGENGFYCIYGNNWTWVVNDGFVEVMKRRIDQLRDQDFAIVLWLFTDDSQPYTNIAKQNFPKYLSDLDALGLLKYASTVVLGLELQDYFNSQHTVGSLAAATRAVYPGKIGTHETSGNYKFAGHGDICFYQVNPGKSAAWIQGEAARVRAATGKPLNFFEMERNPAPHLCDAAEAGGAFATGNR